VLEKRRVGHDPLHPGVQFAFGHQGRHGGAQAKGTAEADEGALGQMAGQALPQHFLGLGRQPGVREGERRPLVAEEGVQDLLGEDDGVQRHQGPLVGLELFDGYSLPNG